MKDPRPNALYYRITQVVCWFFSHLIFRRKVLRNEIKKAKGPFLVIANHQAAYDFTNLFCAHPKPMNFVVSSSFFHSLPLKNFMAKLGVIPKQQFQTTVKDLKTMKAVVDSGRPLVIYPAGLMCEDGLPTPFPTSTYKLFKWLGVDVYMARSAGTYFAMPKWTKGFRPGKTTLDIYKLFSKEDLETATMEEIRAKTDKALDFDAYKEQEQLQFTYLGGNNVEGLEHVLYQCPHCHEEFTIQVRDKDTLYCTQCGFAQKSDKMGFLHNCGDTEEIRYVSDWSKGIYERLKARIQSGEDLTLSCPTDFHMIDPKKNKFVPAGQGQITLNSKCFVLEGVLHGQDFSLSVPIGSFASLPFKPGKYIEVQDGPDIYRCVLGDGKLAMKFINLVKIRYELHKR
jgi:1-acyl-sn-glycerol-3-phosphate acyltransferase